MNEESWYGSILGFFLFVFALLVCAGVSYAAFSLIMYGSYVPLAQTLRLGV